MCSYIAKPRTPECQSRVLVHRLSTAQRLNLTTTSSYSMSKRSITNGFGDPLTKLRHRLRERIGRTSSQPEAQLISGHPEPTPSADQPSLSFTDLSTHSSSTLLAAQEPAKGNGNNPWAKLVTALRGLEHCSAVFPPLKPAVSALVDCLNLLPVCFFTLISTPDVVVNIYYM
jgi:hypothetical protein